MMIEGMQESTMGERVMSDAVGSVLVRARELIEESPEEAPEFLARARAALNHLEFVLLKPHCGAAAYGESFNLAVLSLAALALVAEADATGELG